MKNSRVSIFAVGVLFFLAGCEEEPSPASKGDAGPPSTKPALDPSLARAVESASSTAKAGKGARGNNGGPPPNGIFGPGEADKELRASAPAKITVGSTGSEPRVSVTGMQPAVGSKRSGTIQLELATGPQQGLPPIEFSLSLQAQKLAAPAEPSTEGAAAAPTEVGMLVTVTGTKLVELSGMGREFGSALEKLKGSRIEYRVAANGAGNDYRFTIPKGADPGLDNVVRSLTEALATMTLPFPSEPIGSGAYFMAVTREQSVGVDVVAYRLVKVTNVKDDKLTLSVNTKRYATSDAFDMPGVPQDLGKLKLQEFQSTADGTLEVLKGTPIAVRSELTQTLNAGISAEKQPKQRLALQAQARSEFTLSGVALTAAPK
jgi:hypothetical protein